MCRRSIYQAIRDTDVEEYTITETYQAWHIFVSYYFVMLWIFAIVGWAKGGDDVPAESKWLVLILYLAIGFYFVSVHMMCCIEHTSSGFVVSQSLLDRARKGIYDSYFTGVSWLTAILMTISIPMDIGGDESLKHIFKILNIIVIWLLHT